VGRDRPSGGPPNGLGTLQSGGLTRWLGRLPTWTAILVLAVFALVGVIFTLVAGQEPGTLLGVFLILGSIAAALGIRRGKVYLLFPAPALAFFVAAIVTGKVHDAKLGSSTAGLGAGFTQWVAGIFFPAVIATILVLLIGGGRWVLGRQLITGQSPLSGGGRPAPGKARPAPSADRPAVDNWADDDPFEDRALHTQVMPSPRQDRPNPGGGNPRPARPPRDQRPDRPGRDQRPDRPGRDPWGDPRLPPDRSQQSGPRPRQNGRPPQDPQQRNVAARPSFNPAPAPAPAPQRSRRQPPEAWTQR
jgi:hypothetical protein